MLSCVFGGCGLLKCHYFPEIEAVPAAYSFSKFNGLLRALSVQNLILLFLTAKDFVNLSSL